MSFFGFIGKALGGILGGVGHLVPGPVGMIAGGLGSVLGGGRGGNLPGGSTMQAGALGFAGGGFGGVPMGMPTFSPGGGFSAAGPGTGGGGSALIPHMACGISPTGRHMHHKKPHTKAERHTWFALPCVSNRRMNVANPKALRRSIRRLYGAEKMYRRLLRVTHPHRKGSVHPKPPRRRKR